jgi:hypothetical protein
MSIKLELNGIVYQKGEPTTRNNYTNQDMILHIPDLEKENYSDFFKIEWNDKGIKTLQEANIADGDEVKVIAYLSGKKWTDKEGADRAFNAIKGYAIEKAEKENSADQELTPFPILDTPEKETKNDLPF